MNKIYTFFVVMLFTTTTVFTQQWETVKADAFDGVLAGLNNNTVETGAFIYTNVPNAALLKSNDLGQSWQVCGDNYFNIDSSHGLITFAAKDSLVVGISSNGSLVVSKDAGETWTKNGTEEFANSPRYIALFGDTISVIKDSSLYYSYDDGSTWNKGDSIEFSYPQIYTGKNKTIFANYENIVFTKDGKSIDTLELSPSSRNTPSNNVSSIVESDEFIFANFEDSFAVYDKLNKKWNVSDYPGIPSGSYIAGHFYYQNALHVCASRTVGGNTYFWLYKYSMTHNEFDKQTVNGLRLNLFYSTIELSNGEVLALGIKDFYKSSDGINWSAYNNPLYRATHILLFKSNDRLFANPIFNGLYYSDDYGKTWVNANNDFSSDSIYFTRFFHVNNTLLGQAQDLVYGPKFYKSTDNGSSWQTLSTPADFNPIDVIFIGHSNSSLFVHGYDTLSSTYKYYRTSNAGGSYTNISGNIPSNIKASALERDMQIFEMGGSLVLLGRANNSQDSVYVSNNNGDSFTEFMAGLPTIFDGISLCLTSDQMYLTLINKDGVVEVPEVYLLDGSSWSKLTGNGLQNQGRIYDVVNVSDTLYVSSPFGIFRSLDFGANFIVLDSGMRKSTAFGFYNSGLMGSGRRALINVGSDLFAIGDLFGIYRYSKKPLFNTGIKENQEHALKVFPNPVSNHFSLSMYMGHGESATLSIKDIQGKTLETRQIISTSDGISTLNWEVGSLPSGWYLIQFDGEVVRSLPFIKQ